MANHPVPTHDETPAPVRLAQAIPAKAYGGLLAVALVTGAITLVWQGLPVFGAVSACASALSAAGFVLHDRPRVLSKRWRDLSWDPEMEDLAKQGLIDYDSSATAVWVIREAEHRKGRFPTMRLIERFYRDSPWSEWGMNFVVSPHGDITVIVGVERTGVDEGREVALIIS